MLFGRIRVQPKFWIRHFISASAFYATLNALIVWSIVSISDAFLCIFQQKNFPNAYPTASHSESVLRLNEHVHLLNQLMTWCRKIIPNAIALMQRKIFNRSWKWARMCRINTKHIKKIIWVLLKKRHSEKSNLQISIKSNVKMNKSIIHISQQYNAG